MAIATEDNSAEVNKSRPEDLEIIIKCYDDYDQIIPSDLTLVPNIIVSYIEARSKDVLADFDLSSSPHIDLEDGDTNSEGLLVKNWIHVYLQRASIAATAIGTYESSIKFEFENVRFADNKKIQYLDHSISRIIVKE